MRRCGASVSSRPENALAYVDDVVRLDGVGHGGGELLDGAGVVLAVQAEAHFAAAHGGAASLCQCLHDGHAAFDAVGAGALRFAVDVEDRGAMDVQCVTAAGDDVGIGLSTGNKAGMSIFWRKGLPLRTPVRMAMSSPPGVAPPAAARMSLTRVLSVSSRTGQDALLARAPDLIPAHLHQGDVDLRLLDKDAFERLGDAVFGCGDREAAEFDGTDQGIGDRAVLEAQVSR